MNYRPDFFCKCQQLDHLRDNLLLPLALELLSEDGLAKSEDILDVSLDVPMTEVPVVDNLADDADDIVKTLDLGVVELILGQSLEVLEVFVENGQDVGIEGLVLFLCDVLLSKLVEDDARFEGEVEIPDLMPRIALHFPLLEGEERVLDNVHHAVEI
jgi:hypothetical protein